VAERLTANTRATDTVSQLGGDEFVIMLTDIRQLENIAQLTRKLLSAFKNPIEIVENELHVGTSIGITLFPNDGETYESLLRNADSPCSEPKPRAAAAMSFTRRITICRIFSGFLKLDQSHKP